MSADGVSFGSFRRNRGDGSSNPSLQHRKTLLSHIQDNMSCAGRKTYFQRIIFLAKHCVGRDIVDVKDFYVDFSTEVNKNASDDKLTGLVLIYKNYTVQMIEGSEIILGRYMVRLAAKEKDLYDNSRVVLIYNNANQRIFNKIIWRLAAPQEEKPSDLPVDDGDEITEQKVKTDDPLENSAAFLKIIYDLAKYINFDDLDDNSTVSMLYLPSTYNDLIPSAITMNAILAIDFLPTVSEYGSKIFGVIPQHYHHSELVWPVTYDFTPHNIFHIGKYNVNLTFGNDKYDDK
ncbi:uncharacterized protein DMENIID0001_045930 [Sergentomyia squamirostris]